MRKRTRRLSNKLSIEVLITDKLNSEGVSASRVVVAFDDYWNIYDEGGFFVAKQPAVAVYAVMCGHIVWHERFRPAENESSQHVETIHSRNMDSESDKDDRKLRVKHDLLNLAS